MSEFFKILNDLEKVLDRVKEDENDHLNSFVRIKIKDFRTKCDPEKNRYFVSVDMYKTINPISFFMQELYVKYYNRKSVCYRLRKIQTNLYDLFKNFSSAAHYNWITTPPRVVDYQDSEEEDIIAT